MAENWPGSLPEALSVEGTGDMSRHVSSTAPVWILGAGYTGARVARLLLAAGPAGQRQERGPVPGEGPGVHARVARLGGVDQLV